MVMNPQQNQDEAFDDAYRKTEQHVHAGFWSKSETHWLIKNLIGTLFAALLLALVAYVQRPTEPKPPGSFDRGDKYEQSETAPLLLPQETEAKNKPSVPLEPSQKDGENVNPEIRQRGSWLDGYEI